MSILAPSIKQENGWFNEHLPEEAVVTHPMTPPLKKTGSTDVPLLERPIFTPRRLKVICVGAGYSGLMLAYSHTHKLKMSNFVDLTIYEKNYDVGGTWLENRYPGIGCDVPAHVYVFPWEPNPDFDSFYATGPEIWAYIRKTTTKYHLDEHVKFNSRVIESIWDDSTSKWHVKVERNGQIIRDDADVLVNGSGILNKWKWPSIDGLDSYKGKLIHSAAWDQSLDWEGKRVAVIGNGSSAIQILPKMQKTAAKLTTYIRTPTWICSNLNETFAPEGKNFKFSEEQKQRFRDHPEELTKYRKEIEHDFNKNFPVFIHNSQAQAGAYEGFKQLMSERLGHDERLISKLVPKWDVGCRRLTPGDGYLEALRAENVKCQFDPILRFTEKGIQTAEGEEEFDIVVCATGFDVSFCPFWKLVGRDGTQLAEQWAGNPEAYFGICAAGVPNYFIFNGPNCPVGHGSLLAVIDWTSEYILRWCQKIATHDISSVVVKSDAVAEFNVYAQEFLKTTVWASGCRSWYKNGTADGKVTAMYAGSILHYKECLEKDRGEDFDIRYRSPNRFRFLGNGFTQREANGENLSFYMTK
ncbi:putative sterigmatocystin biosynthesis monooxygenase stcW [Lachnellula cervina]|uniref:Putative sterigmatocystin biosynthesis monooxygenase stcW n=1 Tax=Lachnellula cervina TaxID=1316786 RepID=A0A7D8YTP5_9HELO|nr:putative sterigmatocystin biosynthesis monooxygenase stcW [Lachnellula cervina]